jgi:hypothetical protein
MFDQPYRLTSRTKRAMCEIEAAKKKIRVLSFKEDSPIRGGSRSITPS